MSNTSELEMVLRLSMAAALGSVIGFEREEHRHLRDRVVGWPLGFREIHLVALCQGTRDHQRIESWRLLLSAWSGIAHGRRGSTANSQRFRNLYFAVHIGRAIQNACRFPSSRDFSMQQLCSQIYSLTITFEQFPPNRNLTLIRMDLRP